MEKKNSVLLVLTAVVVTNGFGILLKYFELDTFIIILGFRFHISLVLPFLFVSSAMTVNIFKQEFLNPVYKKNYPYVISLFIPLVLTIGGFIWGYIELGDPDFFYELGLSSLLDLPIYIVWNSVQIVLFYFFLLYASKVEKFRIPVLFFSIILPVTFEFIFIGNDQLDIAGLVSLFFTGIALSVIITRFRNIYWFTIFFFMIFWLFILLFGSASPALVKLIFASQYTSWDGFLIADKAIKPFLFPFYVFFVSIIIFILSLSRKKGKIIL